MKAARKHTHDVVGRNGTTSDDLGAALQREMDWLASLIDARIRRHFRPAETAPDPASLAPPPQPRGSSRYATLLERIEAGPPERVLLALALAPHVAPHVLDVFFLKNEQSGRGFTEFGGIKGVNHSGFLPTGETALFLLSGDDLGQRFAALELFDPEHLFYREGILRGHTPPADEPWASSPISVSSSCLRHLLTGEVQKPDYGTHFPAKRISTPLDWSDLVLDPEALDEIGEIKAWATHREELLSEWGLARQLRPGFRSLFFGPPGTGKTLTASLLGKELEVDVYRIDLSQVVSKFIGETEKNLAEVFDQASQKNWILFFDEADALFGKRTQTSSAHDRYANQEVSYLLQRVEEHPGIVILATNLKTNLDDAFTRRFQSMIYFSPPNASQRRQLWRNCFGSATQLGADVNLDRLAREHELTGGQIVNVVRHSCLMAVQRPDATVRLADITRGIEREFKKQGRSL